MILNIRGKRIEIPRYVATQIPFIDALKCESNEIIEVNTLSPRFLDIIIDYVRDEQKLSFLKTTLEREFDVENIQKYLKYLGMKETFDMLYENKQMSLIYCTICVNCRGKLFDIPLIVIDC